MLHPVHLAGVRASLLLLAACHAQPSGRDSAEPLRSVDSVDLDRYLGRWFEIAL